MKNESKRWLIALGIIAAVVALSAALIFMFRGGPGDLLVQTISDGSGGAITAWRETNGIYIQHVNSSGELLWEKGGIKIAVDKQTDTGAMYPSSFSLVPDGAGGAFITWADRIGITDDRDDPAYFNPVPVRTQHVSAAGELLWGDSAGTGKVEIWAAGGLPDVIPDGSGGIIYAWDDSKPVFRALHDDFLKVQKLNAAGESLWGDNGILITASNPFRALTDEDIARGIKGTYTRDFPTYEGRHNIVSDGAGGAFIFWEEDRLQSGSSMHAQHIDGNGNLVWQEEKSLGTGSIYRAFSDGRGGVTMEISPAGGGRSHIVSLDDEGNIRWDKQILNAPDYMLAGMESDGQGGAFLVLYRQIPGGEPGPSGDIIHQYVTKMNDNGDLLWPEISVFSQETGTFNAVGLGIVPVEGGCYAVFREGTGSYLITGDVFCQRLDADGNISWQEGGLEVFTDTSIKHMAYPQVISDSAGGIIITAAVGKNAFAGDMVYAQRMDKDGSRLWGDGIRIDR